jgi:hypothetical protein
MKKRSPHPLLPLLAALPLILAAAAALIAVVPTAREWLLAAAKVAVIP